MAADSRDDVPSDDTLILMNRATLVQHTVRTAVHELNNVLQMIAGSAELLGAAALPPNAMAKVDAILKHSGRGHALVQAVGELARHTPAAPRTVDLLALCDQALQLRRYEHKRTAITATLERPAAGGGRVRGDAPQLLQAVLNLIVNAEQAVAGVPGATIRLVVTQSEGQVDVTVRDSGPGLASRGDLFDPFVTTRDHAAGLGLAATRLIARRFNGDLEAVDGALRLRLPALPAGL